MNVNVELLKSYKEKLVPTGWMRATVIDASERVSPRGLNMFELHFEVTEEYNESEENENTLGYRISSVAVYPDATIQGEKKAIPTGQAFQTFLDAFELEDGGQVTAQDVIGKEVMINVTYETGTDGKDRPKISFGGYAKIEG